MEGALIIDKPEGITSHDAVVAVRRLLQERRVGHLGTLDPFATGVLVMLLGRATRLARYYRDRQKSYEGVMRVGFATDTMDRTGMPLAPDRKPELDQGVLAAVFEKFTGPILQQPPAISAKKLGGKPACRLARKGVAVELPAVPVAIHELKLLWVDGSRAGFSCRVSSGTYVRSLVNDIGDRLGTGAHVESLRRTAVGEFTGRDAIRLQDWKEGTAGVPEVTPLAGLLPELPAVKLSSEQTRAAANGINLELKLQAEHLRLMSPEGGLIAIAERIAEGLYHPQVVLVAQHERAPKEALSGP